MVCKGQCFKTLPSLGVHFGYSVLSTSCGFLIELLWRNSALIYKSHFIVPQGSLREHFYSKQFT